MDMNNFINRLASFATFPDNVLVSSVTLSNNGFFHTGIRDEVECYQCHIKLKDWKEGDVPADRHYRNSPGCEFLKASGYRPPSESRNGLVTNVVPNNPNQTSLENRISQPNRPNVQTGQVENGTRNVFENFGPTGQTATNQSVHTNVGNNQAKVQIKSNNDVLHVLDEQGQRREDDAQWFTRRTLTNENSLGPGETDFTIERNRLASYVGNWPVNTPISPQELAAAGLYYIGPNDKVKCAWCKGGMYNWEIGDTGMGEHAKHFPQCPFVKQKLSEALTRNPSPTRSRQPVSQENTRQPVSQENTRQPVSQEITSQHNTGASNWRESSVVKIAMDMGYDMKLIEKAVGKLAANGQSITTELLVDTLFEIENNPEELSTDAEPEIIGMDTAAPPTTETAEGQTTIQRNGEKKVSELSELMDENLRLKESTTCKICLENDVDTLFLPCRHLVCCEECSEAVRHCPLCRTLIVGTVKTFLS